MPLNLEYEDQYWETRYWDADITKALNELDEREDCGEDERDCGYWHHDD